MESSISCSIWTKVQLKCVHCSFCVQVHVHPFKPFRTAHGTKIKNCQVNVSLRNCHKFHSNLHAIQPNSSHHSIHRNSSHHHTRNCPCKNRHWDTSVQIPVFLNLSRISCFSRPDRPVFEVLPLYEALVPMEPLDFPLDILHFLFLCPLPSLLDHDLLCLPLPDDCLPLPLRALQSR